MRGRANAGAALALLLVAAAAGAGMGVADAQEAAPAPSAPIASPPPTAPPPPAASAPSPGQGDPAASLIRVLYGAMEASVASGGEGATSVRARAGALADAFDKIFDFPVMLRLSLGGARWREIPAPKQRALVETFQRYFTATYATRLAAAIGGRFEVTPESEARANGVRLVHTRVTDAGGNEAPVDFLVGIDNKVTDVLLNGTVSELATLRSELVPPYKSGGADGLDAFLKQRTETMLAAKPAAR